MARPWLLRSGARDQAVTSAVRPARVTGRKPPPRSPFRIVFFALEQEHLITQKDDRIGAGASAGDMTMVVHILRRDQRRHITAPQDAFVRQAQLRPAALVGNRVPSLMSLHPADRGDPDPATVGVGV